MHQLLELLAAFSSQSCQFVFSPFPPLFQSGEKITYFAISLELLVQLDWNFVWVQGLATGCHTPNHFQSFSAFKVEGCRRYCLVLLTWKFYIWLGILSKWSWFKRSRLHCGASYTPPGTKIIRYAHCIAPNHLPNDAEIGETLCTIFNIERWVCRNRLHTQMMSAGFCRVRICYG